MFLMFIRNGNSRLKVIHESFRLGSSEDFIKVRKVNYKKLPTATKKSPSLLNVLG